MYSGKTRFAQVMDSLPWTTFRRILQRYHDNNRIRTRPRAEQFRVMAIAQLTFRESLRDIERCLAAQAQTLYHIGLRHPVRRSTLADASESREWRVYAEFAQRLISRAQNLYASELLGVELYNTVYALNSTTIGLRLSVFPSGCFRRTKAAVKLHTLLDLRGAIPSFIPIRDGRFHDVNVLNLLLPEPSMFYIMDRGYLDFARALRLDQVGNFVVTCAKGNLDARRMYSAPVDRKSGLMCDQTIALNGFYSAQDYLAHLRRIRYRDPDTGKGLGFLTNHKLSPALSIWAIYECRWKLELSFKWIKQHLRIRRFYGTSENAVKTQIWIAVSVYLLIAIIRKQLNLTPSMHTLLQTLSVTLLEKMPLQRVLDENAMADLDPELLN